MQECHTRAYGDQVRGHVQAVGHDKGNQEHDGAGSPARRPFSLRIIVESHPPCHNVGGHISHRAMLAVGMAAQPDQRLGLGHPELGADHPGSLVDLGPVSGRLAS